MLLDFLHAMKDFLESMGVYGLIIVAFTESSFFLIPPDAFLIPLALANPNQAILYAFHTTLFSVLGALFGYWLGIRLGRPFLSKFASEATIAKAEGLFEKYGIGAVIISGFTPIPFKVFTILSGVVRFQIPGFILGCIIGRGLRFFAQGLVIYAYGDEAVSLMERYGTWVMVLLVLVCVAGLALYYLWQKRKKRG